MTIGSERCKEEGTSDARWSPRAIIANTRKAAWQKHCLSLVRLWSFIPNIVTPKIYHPEKARQLLTRALRILGRLARRDFPKESRKVFLRAWKESPLVRYYPDSGNHSTLAITEEFALTRINIWIHAIGSLRAINKGDFDLVSGYSFYLLRHLADLRAHVLIGGLNLQSQQVSQRIDRDIHFGAPAAPWSPLQPSFPRW